MKNNHRVLNSNILSLWLLYSHGPWIIFELHDINHFRPARPKPYLGRTPKPAATQRSLGSGWLPAAGAQGWLDGKVILIAIVLQNVEKSTYETADLWMPGIGSSLLTTRLNDWFRGNARRLPQLTPTIHCWPMADSLWSAVSHQLTKGHVKGTGLSERAKFSSPIGEVGYFLCQNCHTNK